MELTAKQLGLLLMIHEGKELAAGQPVFIAKDLDSLADAGYIDSKDFSLSLSGRWRIEQCLVGADRINELIAHGIDSVNNDYFAGYGGYQPRSPRDIKDDCKNIVRKVLAVE
jgi:hypothetical protein